MRHNDFSHTPNAVGRFIASTAGFWTAMGSVLALVAAAVIV